MLPSFFILQFICYYNSRGVSDTWKVEDHRYLQHYTEVAMDAGVCWYLSCLYAQRYELCNIVGVLRSGGDTRMCLFLDTSGVWCIGVPLAFLGALVWHLPIYGVYALVMSEEVYKLILKKYATEKWLLW